MQPSGRVPCNGPERIMCHNDIPQTASCGSVKKTVRLRRLSTTGMERWQHSAIPPPRGGTAFRPRGGHTGQVGTPQANRRYPAVAWLNRRRDSDHRGTIVSCCCNTHGGIRMQMKNMKRDINLGAGGERRGGSTAGRNHLALQ